MAHQNTSSLILACYSEFYRFHLGLKDLLLSEQ